MRFKILSIVMILSILFGSVYASDSSLPRDNLDFWSKVRVEMFGNSLTIQGQQNGCSVNPDGVRKNLYVENTRTVKPKLISLVTGLSNNGLINIYRINPDSGNWKFLKEIAYDESYTFIGGSRYALEFYNCAAENDQIPYETSDGLKDGELVCKQGQYLAEIHFTSKYSYEYKKVADCDGGCTSVRDCSEPAQNDNVMIEHTGDDDETIETKTEEEFMIAVSDVVEEMKQENKEIVDWAGAYNEWLKINQEKIPEDINNTKISDITCIGCDGPPELPNDLDSNLKPTIYQFTMSELDSYLDALNKELENVESNLPFDPTKEDALFGILGIGAAAFATKKFGWW